ncbi:AAA family ATPase [Oceanivirga salmonicida]|uniref:AAA family ATPase n=1 Tax=Oceanivirga salmonicida TaxID=1769291 RepID=UPI0012E0D188|nr:AAA family ATPase [Oceanivirga salmonicida]
MINKLNIKNYKNISNAEIEFKKNISGIYGPNGSGKTSVIEVVEIIKNYFLSIPFPQVKKDELKEKLIESFKIGEDTLEIELEIESDKYIYLLILKIHKNEFNDFTVLNEEILYKTKKAREKFKRLIKIENDSNQLKPKVFLFRYKSDCFDEIQKEILDLSGIKIQTLISKFNDLNSYTNLVCSSKYKIESDKYNELNKHWKNIFGVLKNIRIIGLKEQALTNLELLIPLSINSYDIFGTIPIANKNSINNKYSEKDFNLISATIKDINKLFPLFTKGASIQLDSKMISNEDGVNYYSIEIFVIRNNQKIGIYNESTGTIKLFRMLSSLIYVLKNKKGILLVDELDIHIFEYLLSYILEMLKDEIVGQMIFTAHNLFPMEKLEKNSIILANEEDGLVNYVYFKGKISPTTNLRLRYIKSQYLGTEENISPFNIKELLLKKIIRELRD